MGSRGRVRVGDPALLDRPRPVLAAAGRRDRGAARPAARRGRRPRRALRHGRLVAGARGHLRHGRRGPDGPGLHRPRRTCARPWPTGWTAPSSWSRASPGRTVETDSQRRAYEAAFTEAGIDPAERIVVVTDPGSPLDEQARAAGYRVVNADPNVGGRYSALTAFGLVPSGLAGADIEALLDEAEAVADLLAEDDEANPGLRLAAAMAGTSPLRDKLAILDSGSGIVGFADWAEQLIAETTGKDGTGILPVVVGDRRRPRGALAGRRRPRSSGSSATPDEAPSAAEPRRRPAAVRGPRQRLARRPDAALGGRHRGRRPAAGINPFDQPDVESAKKAARGLLDASGGAGARPAFTDGASRSAPSAATGSASATTVADGARRAARPARPAPRLRRGDGLPRPARRRRAGRRAAPGAGAAYRAARRRSAGGRGSCTPPASSTRAARPPASSCRSPPTPHQDLASPAATFTFGDFIAAQAAGDAQVLADHGRPVLRLHLTDHDAGLAQLAAVLRLSSSSAPEGDA